MSLFVISVLPICKFGVKFCFVFLVSVFSTDKVPEKLDAIVIGSGIGGQGVAALLARVGKRVLVLEQLGKLGGCCHTFNEKGYEFDVGECEAGVVWFSSHMDPQTCVTLHANLFIWIQTIEDAAEERNSNKCNWFTNWFIRSLQTVADAVCRRPWDHCSVLL